MATPSLPANAHVSTHPCVLAKLSLLRSPSTSSREVKSLIHSLTLLIGTSALSSSLSSRPSGQSTSALGYPFTVQTIHPGKISIVPILRSGLAMVDALELLLPHAVPVHHLGLYREKSTLQPVEYYNNLPYHKRAAATVQAGASSEEAPEQTGGPADLAVVVDPIIATGATAMAAVETLREYGVKKVVIVSILGSVQGVSRVAEFGGEEVEVWVGGVDEGTDGEGMIVPGLGDVGDRLFLTMGK